MCSQEQSGLVTESGECGEEREARHTAEGCSRRRNMRGQGGRGRQLEEVKWTDSRVHLESEEGQGKRLQTSNHCRNLESSTLHSQVLTVKLEAGGGR